MDRIVERLVRQVTAARRRGDEATRIMVWARLTSLRHEPGFIRALDRAIATVDWR